MHDAEDAVQHKLIAKGTIERFWKQLDSKSQFVDLSFGINNSIANIRLSHIADTLGYLTLYPSPLTSFLL